MTRHEPITVEAFLVNPAVWTWPIYLDGLLFHAVGSILGLYAPSGWSGLEDVEAAAEHLPFARIETEHGWWWAASQVAPTGPESTDYAHRRPMFDEALRWGCTGSIQHKTYPDKAIRRPKYLRSSMLRLTWYAVGDMLEVGRLLTRVPSVGSYATHGHGWVRRWAVRRGGPSLQEYTFDLKLRHLPVTLVDHIPDTVTRRRMPLRPPYWNRAAAIDVWQIPEVFS